MKKVYLITALTSLLTIANAQNTVDSVLGSATSTYRADDVPAGDAGRYYIPGAAAAVDNITPSSFSKTIKAGIDFHPRWHMSCGDMNFYTNFSQEAKRLLRQLKNIGKQAEKAVMSTVSGVVTGFQQYILSKINPTLAQISMKNIDKSIKVFEANVKTCEDIARDVQNGKNPLSEIVQIAVGDQWKKTVGLVATNKASLEDEKEELVQKAHKLGVEMADGKRYGGENQQPINVTQSLLKAGMNLVMARNDKNLWDQSFATDPVTIKNNPILKEFNNPQSLYQFIEDIYGSVEKRITKEAASNTSVNTTAGRGYEKKYAEYRNEYIEQLRQYVERGIDRATFEANTGLIIPPAEIQDIRMTPPYERAVEIEQRAQQFAIKRVKDNLIFAKQALKTGIYAPDMQQSSMKGMATEEYKSIYYRIMDDLSEISQRAYQF